MRRLAMISLSTLLLSSPAIAVTYVVNPDGTGDFPTIQAAIDAASNGDVIELTYGVFRGAGNRDIEYRGKAITVRAEGSIPRACIIDCEGSEAEHHRGFIFYHEGLDAVLQDVTIVGGYEYEGGAIYCWRASPLIRRCIFHGNHAVYDGGAFVCWEGSDPTIISTIFAGNSAGHGGGGGFCM